MAIDGVIKESLLFLSSPFVPGESLLFESLSKHLSNGGKVLVYVTDKTINSFLNDADAYNINLRKFVNSSLILKDASGSLLSKSSFKDFKDLVNLDLKGFKGVVCFSNSSVLVDFYGTEFINDIKILGGKFRIVSVFTQWGYDASVIDSLKSVFSKVALIGCVNNYNYCVINDSFLFFNALKGEGLSIVSPKVLLGGEGLMDSLAESSLVIDELSSNFKIGKNVFNYKGLNVDVIKGDFESMIDLFNDEPVNPLIFINDQESFNRAREMINYSLIKGFKPVVGVKSFVDAKRLQEFLKVPVININEGMEGISLVFSELINKNVLN